MPFWKIEPVAARDDPRWLDFTHWEEVIVEAESAAMARIAAARELGGPEETVGNESPSDRTGFEDEKLYRVCEVEETDLPAGTGKTPGVIRATRDGRVPPSAAGR